ncbi:hypothetical protein ACFL1R_09610 [Candidatus Latescibacterota bacterium]
MICKNCKFFSGEDKGKGKCHRYPPKVLKIEAGDIIQTLPIVDEDTFCGEFNVAKERRRMFRSGKYDPL